MSRPLNLGYSATAKLRGQTIGDRDIAEALLGDQHRGVGGGRVRRSQTLDEIECSCESDSNNSQD